MKQLWIVVGVIASLAGACERNVRDDGTSRKYFMDVLKVKDTDICLVVVRYNTAGYETSAVGLTAVDCERVKTLPKLTVRPDEIKL